MLHIDISVQQLVLRAALNDTPTARRIAAALPLAGTVNRWGNEIYFDIPVQIEAAADAVTDVEIGTLAYWPAGAAFCIFFGPTPVSEDEQPRAYSPVNIFGRISDDPGRLRDVQAGAHIRITRADE